MGVFSKVKKTFKGIAKNPTDWRNYADLGAQTLTAGQIDTRGINTSGWVGGKDINLSDALLGKKAKDINPDAITDDIRGAQTQGINAMTKGLGELNTALDTPAENIVRQQSEVAKKSVLSSAQDARRNAQRLMAQRGLQNSSLGLSSARTIDQETGKDLASINAALPGQIRNQSIQDAQTRMTGGQGMFSGLGGNTGMNFNTIEGQRSGGILGIASSLAPLAGTIGGAMAGGPAGAAVGSQVGQGVSTGFNKVQRPGYAGGGTGNYGNYA